MGVVIDPFQTPVGFGAVTFYALAVLNANEVDKYNNRVNVPPSETQSAFDGHEGTVTGGNAFGLHVFKMTASERDGGAVTQTISSPTHDRVETKYKQLSGQHLGTVLHNGYGVDAGSSDYNYTEDVFDYGFNNTATLSATSRYFVAFYNRREGDADALGEETYKATDVFVYRHAVAVLSATYRSIVSSSAGILIGDKVGPHDGYHYDQFGEYGNNVDGRKHAAISRYGSSQNVAIPGYTNTLPETDPTLLALDHGVETSLGTINGAELFVTRYSVGELLDATLPEGEPSLGIDVVDVVGMCDVEMQTSDSWTSDPNIPSSLRSNLSTGFSSFGLDAYSSPRFSQHNNVKRLQGLGFYFPDFILGHLNPAGLDDSPVPYAQSATWTEPTESAYNAWVNGAYASYQSRVYNSLSVPPATFALDYNAIAIDKYTGYEPTHFYRYELVEKPPA